MEPIGGTNVQPATETIGGQPLAYREENGVKVFELTTRAVQWPILDGVTVTAYTYNGTVPGPMIRVTEGDRVRVIVKNDLDDPTTIHWQASGAQRHGQRADRDQAPIPPGGPLRQVTACPAHSAPFSLRRRVQVSAVCMPLHHRSP
jgi:FtsP/CotA-like multicopper oxidase with cupredoxin domain